MKNLALALVFTAFSAATSIAAQPVQGQAALDKATQEDIARHRTMALAHENAAKCLASGKSDEVCEKQLQLDCKGLAIGKFCGMKHTH
ncbi:hypothetical protein [Rhodoferax sp.]|uniref:hypothetical protein n=1 Tax=Rhodoferax sp. TaxID=50421 RepID=UPI00261676CB|nr:hypothetical protein [Rhodoferax sp.]MDD2924274.1 hypothetical protein [Rhodoferax sp.]